MPIELTTAAAGTINGIRDALVAPSKPNLTTEETARIAGDVSLDARVDVLEALPTLGAQSVQAMLAGSGVIEIIPMMRWATGNPGNPNSHHHRRVETRPPCEF